MLSFVECRDCWSHQHPIRMTYKTYYFSQVVSLSVRFCPDRETWLFFCRGAHFVRRVLTSKWGETCGLGKYEKVYVSCAHYSTEWKERTCCVLVHTKWSKAKRTPERPGKEKNYENSKQNHNFPQTIKLNITKWLNIFNIDCCIAFIINFKPLHPHPGFTSPLIVLLLRLSCHKKTINSKAGPHRVWQTKNLNF